WRRGWDSNPRMEVLQTSPLGHLGTAPEPAVSISKTCSLCQRRDGANCDAVAIGDEKRENHGNESHAGTRIHRSSGSGLDVGFAKKSRRFLRWSGTDIKSSSPLKPGDLRQLGDNLDMPVIMIVNFFAYRGCMQHEIVCGMVERGVKPAQIVL